MTSRSRPRPSPDESNRFFWDGVADGELRFQRCLQCAAVRHPPRFACPRCASLEWDLVVSTGSGTLYSYCVPRRPPAPFLDGVVFAVVELDEGVRMVSNLVDLDAVGPAIGMALEVVFETEPTGEILPLFRPAGTGRTAAELPLGSA